MQFTPRPFLLALATTSAAVTLAARPAGAAVAYAYAAGAASYASGSAGQGVTVPIYLRETLTGGSASLLTSESGLSGAGVTVTRQASGAAAITGATLNPAFSGPAQGPTTSASQARFTESAPLGATAGVPATLVSNDGGTSVYQVFLGNVTIASAAAPTTFTLSAFVNGNGTIGGNTVTFANGYDLDATRTATPAYTAAASTSFVVAVPEPATLAAAAGVAAVAAGRRRRRAVPA